MVSFAAKDINFQYKSLRLQSKAFIVSQEDQTYNLEIIINFRLQNNHLEFNLMFKCIHIIFLIFEVIDFPLLFELGNGILYLLWEVVKKILQKKVLAMYMFTSVVKDGSLSAYRFSEHLFEN